LGGTGFIGRAIASLLPSRTLFNRGTDRSMPGLVGDRDAGDYAAIRSGTWDAVVDRSGYFPWQVSLAIDAFGSRVGRYLRGGGRHHRRPEAGSVPPGAAGAAAVGLADAEP
jgi:2'-hydroxyisoflavone reductase